MNYAGKTEIDTVCEYCPWNHLQLVNITVISKVEFPTTCYGSGSWALSWVCFHYAEYAKGKGDDIAYERTIIEVSLLNLKFFHYWSTIPPPGSQWGNQHLMILKRDQCWSEHHSAQLTLEVRVLRYVARSQRPVWTTFNGTKRWCEIADHQGTSSVICFLSSQGSISTLVQVMACCPMAPSHTGTNVDLAKVFCPTLRIPISQEASMNFMCNTCADRRIADIPCGALVDKRFAAQ